LLVIHGPSFQQDSTGRAFNLTIFVALVKEYAAGIGTVDHVSGHLAGRANLLVGQMLHVRRNGVRPPVKSARRSSRDFTGFMINGDG
jgi:hypothetical protein